jgi:4-diphosphocytidyl-2-C-methyl-D-erythritol kinase
MVTPVSTGTRAGSFCISAPAKINLHLRVGPPTADGFHPLLSWMMTVGLFDKLEFVSVDKPGIKLHCDDPLIPCDGSNLVVRTASALLEMVAASGQASWLVAGQVGVGISAALQKRIPVGAGLGGGSSDGAFALMALDRMFGLNWSAERLAGLAARFGSDLSFFFHGPSSICTGRGEIVSPTLSPMARWAVLILPGIHMATPAVYRRFDEMRLGDCERITQQPDWRQWARLPALELLPRLVNDLEAPAFSLSPALMDLRERVAQALGRVVRMSGSGSSLFTLFDLQDEAEHGVDVVKNVVGVRTMAVEVCPKLPQGSDGMTEIH